MKHLWCFSIILSCAALARFCNSTIKWKFVRARKCRAKLLSVKKKLECGGRQFSPFRNQISSFERANHVKLNFQAFCLRGSEKSVGKKVVDCKLNFALAERRKKCLKSCESFQLLDFLKLCACLDDFNLISIAMQTRFYKWIKIWLKIEFTIPKD